MDCSEVLERLDELLTGDLYGTEAARAMLHIRRCYTCQEEYNSLKEMLEDCRAGLSHPRPVDRFDLLLRRIAAEERIAAAAPRQERRYAIAALASIDWSWRIARIGTAAFTAGVLALCVGSRPGPDPLELPRVIPQYLTYGHGRMMEPADASSRSLLEYAANLQRLLEMCPPPSPPMKIEAPASP